LEHSGANDILIVAGKVGNISEDLSKDKKIMYVGNLSYEQLLSVYKSSKYFIHLSWLDHCPNVVVDARASGCQIICSSTGGTKEIAGKDAIIIKEEEWDFMPINLYDPPILNFNNKIDNKWDIDYTMDYCSSQYEEYLSSNLK
jgi:glycosyltransferase involved in cell wall biosynthesis